MKNKEKSNKNHSFIKDGLSMKELLVILTYLITCIFFFANIAIIILVLQKINEGNAKELIPIIVDFVKQSTVYYTVPYMIIICFYFLNSKTLELAKAIVSKKLPDVKIETPIAEPINETPSNTTETTEVTEEQK